LDFSKRNSLVKNIAIFSDSLSSLNAIKAGKSLCRSNVLNEINDLIDDINVDIKFIWVPSHLGVTGNEIADLLAQSTIINDTSVTVSFELKEIYALVQEYIITKWQHLWQFSSTGKFYRKIEPNVFLKIKYENSIRRKEIIITRMRFGICLTNDYLKRIIQQHLMYVMYVMNVWKLWNILY